MIARNLRVFLVSLSVLAVFSACAVYHSSDRDNFNANAIYGAPAASKAQNQAPTKSACYTVSGDIGHSQTANLDVIDREEDWLIQRPDSANLEVTMAKRLSTVTSPSAAICSFEFVSTVSDENAVERSKALVESFAQTLRQ